MSYDQAKPAPSVPKLEFPGGSPQLPPLRLVPLSMDVLHALRRNDLEAAAEISGVRLTPYFAEHGWLWDIRIAQIARDPTVQEWIARAALDLETVVGHVGFHGPPDERGMIEVAYSVDPHLRRRGYATRMLASALIWAQGHPGVTTVRATVAPDNAASIATLAGFPFARVGEQWDDVDGLEFVYEMRLA